MIKHILAVGAVLASATTAVAETKIEFWHAMGGRLGEVVNEIAGNFNEAQNEVELTPVFKGTYEETLTAGIAAFRAGEQPNIIQVFDAGAATIIGAPGAVIPVEDLLTQQGVAFDINDYISGVRYFYADPAGKMVGMPFNSSTPIMYYNVGALEKAGVTPPKTWEEFESVTAPALVEAGYIPLAQSHLPWIFTENFMSRHDLQFASNANGYEGVEGTKLLVNHPGIKAHFTKLKEWLDNGYFAWYGAGWGDNQAPFENQEVAMWLGSSASFGGLSRSAQFDFSATYLPFWEAVAGPAETVDLAAELASIDLDSTTPLQALNALDRLKQISTGGGVGGSQTFIGGAALFAMSGNSNEENAAVAKFFEYLTTADVQYLWHRETGYVPITHDAYDLAKEDGHYDRVPSAEIGIQQLNLPAGEWTRGYRMGFYVQIRDVMNREYGKIFSGEATVDEAFTTIEEEGNRLLERFARTAG